VDADQFDDVLRGLSQAPTRRGIARALGGIALAGPLAALLGRATVEAKKKKRKKKKCKGKKKCGKKCIPKTSCCTSAGCGGGATCQNGACLCPSGQKDCQGTCVPEEDCCPACTGGRVCVAETCECPAGQQDCEGTCIPVGDCCDAADCDDGDPCTENVCNANGTCSNPTSPDFKPCGDGKQCSGGVCAFPPTCQQVGPCPEANPSFCCSNVCQSVDPSPIGQCLTVSDVGEPCQLPGFCAPGSTCVGFVCTA
jgi:hypothetical protein